MFKPFKKNIKNSSGFTLVELLVTMAITLVVVGAMYNVLDSSNRTYSIENEKVEAQTNLRAAMGLLSHELKTAGYDPTGVGTFTILAADETSIYFTRDDTDNHVAFSFDDTNDTLGYAAGTSNVVQTTAINQPVAEDIQAFELLYTDSDGNTTTTPADFRAVEIRILARTKHTFPGYADTTDYPTTQDCEAGYRCIFGTTTIKLRNMGL